MPILMKKNPLPAIAAWLLISDRSNSNSVLRLSPLLVPIISSLGLVLLCVSSGSMSRTNVASAT